jgi:hypothetical protein
MGGQLDCLVWAREHGCEWNQCNCLVWARKGNYLDFQNIESPPPSATISWIEAQPN